MKRIIVGVLFVLLGLGFSFNLVAGDEHKGMHDTTTKVATADVEKVVDAGNKTCPVSGDPVDGKAFAVYKGKRYGFCCSGCDEEFQKDPEKYIKILKDRGDLK